jgi:hypothetical protein
MCMTSIFETRGENPSGNSTFTAHSTNEHADICLNVTGFKFMQKSRHLPLRICRFVDYD